MCSSARRPSQRPTSQVRVCNDLVTPTTVVRDLGIYLDSDVSTCSQVARMDSIKLFFHTETTEKYPSFADSLRLLVHRSCSGIIEAGLRECNLNIGWSPVVPVTPVTVDDDAAALLVFSASRYDKILHFTVCIGFVHQSEYRSSWQYSRFGV